MSKPLRFCMITTFYPPWSFGGDAVYVWQLSNELARRGHHVTVVHCIDSYNMLADGAPGAVYGNHPNVSVHGLESGFGFLSPLATQQTGRPLFKTGRIKEILDTGFDVIHFHNISLVGGPKVLEYGEGLKLYTTHEYWLLCPTHLLMKYNRAPCVSPHCLICQVVHWRPPQLWRYTGLLQRSLNRLDAIISPSRFTVELHEKLGLKVPVVHIPNFIPPDSYPASGAGEAAVAVPEEPYFLYVGRLEKLKGVHNLIPVFREYGRAKLVVAGKGSYEGRLRELAGGSRNIIMTGHLSHAQLRGLYEKATALIIPSICYEISTLVIFEAFREKTPAIVNEIGGLTELIDESGAGFVYRSDRELVSAMDRLIDEPALGEELGLKGYESYLAKWSADSHLKSYLGLIAELRPGEKYSDA